MSAAESVLHQASEASAAFAIRRGGFTLADCGWGARLAIQLQNLLLKRRFAGLDVIALYANDFNEIVERVTREKSWPEREGSRLLDKKSGLR